MRPRSRRLGFVLAAGVLLAAASSADPAAAAALRSPVIGEPWTPLRCPAHPEGTLGFEACLEKDVTHSDRRIDKRVAHVFRLLPPGKSRLVFVQGEHAWLHYRRLSCSAEAAKYRGGSEEPLVFLTCEKRLNLRHIADLAAMERTVRPR